MSIKVLLGENINIAVIKKKNVQIIIYIFIYFKNLKKLKKLESVTFIKNLKFLRKITFVSAEGINFFDNKINKRDLFMSSKI